MDVNTIDDLDRLKSLAYDTVLIRDNAERDLTILRRRINELEQLNPRPEITITPPEPPKRKRTRKKAGA